MRQTSSSATGSVTAAIAESTESTPLDLNCQGRTAVNAADDLWQEYMCSSDISTKVILDHFDMVFSKRMSVVLFDLLDYFQGICDLFILED